MTVQSQAQVELVQCLVAPNPRVALGHWWDRWMVQLSISRRDTPAEIASQLTEDEQLRYERHYVCHRLAEAILSHEAFQLRTRHPFDNLTPDGIRTYSVVVLAPTEKVIR